MKDAQGESFLSGDGKWHDSLPYAIIDHKWRAEHQVPGSFSRLCVDGLESMKHPFTQQRKASLAIALSFDQFELGHLTFHHAVVDPPG